MIFIKRPWYGEKRVQVGLCFKRDAWELWEHTCRVNGLDPVMYFNELVESAMAMVNPEFLPMCEYAPGTGVPGERSCRPPAARKRKLS